MASKYRVTRIVPNDDGGGTLYVGTRGSDVFGRVYDKGAQLGTFPERIYWRWEVEYKRDHARQAYANWSESVNSPNAYQAIAREVGTWYAEHGIPIPTVLRTEWKRPVIRYATRVRSSDTTIEWLYQQVNPALRKLGAAGRLSDAVEALGIWDNQLVMTESELQRLAQWEQTDFLAELQGHELEV
jgi:DNA relaxase NicK